MGRVAAELVLTCALAGCAESLEERDPTVVVVSHRRAPAPAPARNVRVISAEAARTAGWVGKPVSHSFGPGRDGGELVSALMTEAQRKGAIAISDIAITLVSAGEEGPTECRTSMLPETVTETRITPSGTRQVPIQKPVTRMVTDQQNRCHMESRMVTRPATEYAQRCSMVSHPVTRTRTTMSFQYDSFTHSSRSVPRTETYTAYESRQECRSEPVFRVRTESVMQNVCRLEPVTHMVTRYEFQLETQYIPPKVETLSHHRLRESEPSCSALEPAPEESDEVASNRIEAVFYFPPPPAP